jgi:hypothetical protein
VYAKRVTECPHAASVTCHENAAVCAAEPEGLRLKLLKI